MKHTYFKYILGAALCASAGTAMAQGLKSAYYTDGYYYQHDMNPAFGNERNFVAIPVIGNLNLNSYGNFGYEDIVFDNPRYGIDSQKRLTTFMNPYISSSEALSGLNSGDNRIQGDVNIGLLAAGFKAFGGYNTIELNVKTSFGASLPYGLFEFARNTGNRSYDIGDISMRAMGYAELALGHSRQINEKLRLGAKVKFLVGVARADVNLKDVKADLTSDNQWTVSGKAESEVSLKGFKYQSKTKEYKTQSGSYEYVNDVDVDGGGVGGFGLAVDLGGIYKINEDWTVNASILDLGFISWSNNMHATNLSNSFTFSGFHDVDITSESGATIEDKSEAYEDQLAQFANLTDQGDKGGRTTALGATVNLGCEYTLPVYRKISFGALASTRIYGDYSYTEGRLSANWTPLSWLDGGVSFAANSFTTSMGWVLNFHPKGCNIFLGMDHILGKVSSESIPLSSNASFAMGVNVTF